MTKTSNDSALTIGIIGLGAIGCLISSQLPSTSTVYSLPKNVQDQSANISFQLRRENNLQSYQWPVWQGEILDIVLVCCKASQCEEALQQWHAAISPDTQIVLLQNGLGQHDKLSQAFPHHSIFAASTTEGAFRSQPNLVTHAGIGQTQWGFYAGKSQAFKLPLDLLKGNHHWADNIQQVLRDKLAINAVINPLTVKYQCKNGGLLTQKDALNELQQLCEETEKFFHTMGWPLSFDLFDKAQLIAQATADNFSSMLQDVKNERATEIDFINGHLLNKAIEKGIVLPFSQSLVKLVKSYEAEKKV